MSDIKGTTRDVIEDTITLGGTLFRFIDTAGIRESGDVIENMGIERSFKNSTRRNSCCGWLIQVREPTR